MSVTPYYQDELIALRELGREFARRNPALAPFLETPGKDPDVERLLEGVAFLTGRLRQKLDDELPEIIHALFNLLWPNYLRPVPACSILRFEPSENLSGAVSIPRGALVDSVAVEGTKCRFRTAYGTEILPLRLCGQSFIEKSGEASLVLQFETLGVPLANLPVSSLRFFIMGEPAIAQTIYYTMAARTREVRVALPGDAPSRPKVLARLEAADCIRPVGFREEEGLYPYPANTFPGYRILQEYFCFPEKFSFIEVGSLEKALNGPLLAGYDGQAFELHFALRELPARFASFRPENWQLHCTPVVNLFRMDATPIAYDHRQSEYRIVPDPRRPGHFATYSIDRVASWSQGDNENRQYTEFESFAFEDGRNPGDTYYRRRIRPSHTDDSVEVFISIMPGGEGGALPRREIISLELTCTNRNLPRQLGVGDIALHADNTPDSVSFRNITPVVPSFNPPLEGDMLWRLLSNMSPNYIALTNIPALKAVISAYDFRARYDQPRARVLEKTLRGMVDISCRQTDRLHNGLPVRGARTRLVLDQQCFSCEGEMYLFGTVLHEFFALYATVNSFHQLIVVEAKRGEEYRWPVRLGRMDLR
ncbi:MAG: type VI secretion system baseplate subunit TssF [Deltaproteobacteria bacterium]|jgi:type VI secretion system protein ImpG|nr:type VI secretion system baseplate subunit TssF [Deltaproteobacteria bacterium]